MDGEDGIRAFDIGSGLEMYMEKCYPKEPIHPSLFGHMLMGEALLRGLGKDSGSDLLETGIDPRLDDERWNRLFALVRQQRDTYDHSLLNDIGHGNPGVEKRFLTPLDEAVEQVKVIDAEIEALRLRSRVGSR